MIDPVRIEILVNLRKAVRPRISQTRAANFFGLDSKHGRKTIGTWENGQSAADEGRREKFVAYLWDMLGLRNDPEKFEDVWQILVEEWRWKPINDEEWKRFTTVERPSSIEVVFEDGGEPTSTQLPVPEPPRPPETAQFVGREMELKSYAAALSASGIASITGAAGVGKTTLAAQLARQIATPDKFFWHRCYPERDANEITWKLAEFLGWRGQRTMWDYLNSKNQSNSLPPQSTLLDSIFELIRHKGLVLCLDDFHHWFNDDNQSEVVNRLVTLAHAQEIALIVTSRQALSLDDPSTETLAGLNLEDTQVFLSTREVQIEERLLNMLYQRTEGNAELLTLAVQALERTNDAETLIEQLVYTEKVEQFLLTEIDSDLADGEKVVMSGVSALLGYPGTAEAIEEVLDADNVRRPLVHLVNRYLLERFRDDEEKTFTYSQHAIVQSFYYDLLGQRRRRQMHRRAGEYYEHETADVFRAALHYQHGQEHEKAAKLATKDVFGVIYRGSAPAMRSLLSKFKQNQLSSIMWIKVQIMLGHTYEFVEEWDAALERYRDALRQLEGQPETDDVRRLKSETYRGIVIALRHRQPKEAQKYISQGLEIVTGVDPIAEADLRIQMGAVMLQFGDRDGIMYLEESLRLLDSLSTTPRLSTLKMLALLNLGIHRAMQNKLTVAEEHWQDALQIATTQNDVFNQIALGGNLGNLFQMTGHWQKALDMYAETLQQAEAFGKRAEVVRLTINSGVLQMNMGDSAQARAHLYDGVEQSKQFELNELTVTGLTYLGDFYLRQNEHQKSLERLLEAQSLAKNHGISFQLSTIRRLLGHISLLDRTIAQAEEYVELSIEDAKRSSAKVEEGTALRILGLIRAKQEQIEEAQQNFEQSLTLLQQDPYEVARTQEAYGEFLMSIDQRESGLLRLSESLSAYSNLDARIDADRIERVMNQ